MTDARAEGRHLLLFVPGFLTPRDSYDALFEPIAAAGVDVTVVPPERSFMARLAGRVSIHEDAERLDELVAGVATDGTHITVGGHSRGGAVAWLAATHGVRRADIDDVILLDPVWGDGGPRWRGAPPSGMPNCRTLIVGFGVSGPCAPAGRNHEVFAAAAPSAEHVIVAGCGHGDILSNGAACAAGVVCRSGHDRPRARAQVSRLLLDRFGVGDR